MPLTLRTVVWIAIVIVAMIAAASAAVAISESPQHVGHSVRADSNSATAVDGTTVSILPGDTARTMSQRLLEGGAISSESRFDLLVRLLGWEYSLEPGEYRFETILPTFEVLRRIHFGETSPFLVIIPEGLRLEQVIERLSEADVADSVSLTAALSAGAGPLSGEYASMRPAGASLEGYLFPADYRFPLDADAAGIIGQMLRRFDSAISAQLSAQIAERGATLHQVLTIASIIEREAALDHERAAISAVIWNRLAIGMPLQMNSTVQYAVGQAPVWWKETLSDADFALDSPYNSYLYGGLPPTPIASPGLPSIEAAANPADLPYLYFVAKGDGSHAFAVTYEEHLENVERYLAGEQ